MTKIFSAEQYVYALHENAEEPGYIFITLTPQEYWQKEGYAWDQDLSVPDDLLPQSQNGQVAGEEMEATYSVEGRTLQEVDLEMQRLGYIKDANFQAFMDGNPSFDF